MQEAPELALDKTPATVEALLASRLDRLDPRELARRAPRRGDRPSLYARRARRPFADDDVDRHLASLTERGLVHPVQDLFRFHHVLVRDVAYRGIPKAERAELHELAGKGLDRRDGADELVGYHFEQAYRYLTELQREDEHAQRARGRGQRAARARGHSRVEAGGRACGRESALPRGRARSRRRRARLRAGHGASRRGDDLDARRGSPDGAAESTEERLRAVPGSSSPFSAHSRSPTVPMSSSKSHRAIPNSKQRMTIEHWASLVFRRARPRRSIASTRQWRRRPQRSSVLCANGLVRRRRSARIRSLLWPEACGEAIARLEAPAPAHEGDRARDANSASGSVGSRRCGGISIWGEHM